MNIRPESINKIIHEPARLMIMTHLYAVVDADFVYLKRATGMTAGNLSTHITKLEDAGFIKVIKTFKGKKPHTITKLTETGRKAFEDYKANVLEVLGN